MVQVSPSLDNIRPEASNDDHHHNIFDIAPESGATPRLRRQSIDIGITLKVQPGDAPKRTMIELEDLTAGQMKAIAESLIFAIKGSSCFQQAMDTWSSDELPEAAGEEAKIAVRFMKRFLTALAKKINKWLKMARIALTIDTKVALIPTFEDLSPISLSRRSARRVPEKGTSKLLCSSQLWKYYSIACSTS